MIDKLNTYFDITLVGIALLCFLNFWGKESTNIEQPVDSVPVHYNMDYKPNRVALEIHSRFDRIK